MDASPEHIRDFLLELEKTLITRKLYRPHMAPYKDAVRKLLQRFLGAAAEEGFSLKVGPADLFVGDISVIRRDKGEDSFFFPLYRDGLRELRFSPETTPEELDLLLAALEVERMGQLSSSEDTISYLWRSDLENITFKAIDGIGDEEGEDDPDKPREDYASLVADVMSKIRDPAPPETGQSYSFVLDADVRVSAADLHYDAATVRRAFEDNPRILGLAAEEIAALRTEVGAETEAELLDRFIEILVVMLMDPGSGVSATSLAPVFERLLEGYWQAGDGSGLQALLERLDAAAGGAPDPESRKVARDTVDAFLTGERIAETTNRVAEGSLSLAEATSIWNLAGDGIWDLLIDFMSSLAEGEIRAGVVKSMRSWLASKPDLLRSTLSSENEERIRAGLALIDQRFEEIYADELLSLASHPSSAIRLKGLAAAGRLGGEAALEVLWNAMEGDPARSVRLLAFRLVAGRDDPRLQRRLRSLVSEPRFAQRPFWEQEKYVVLLGSVAGESARALFQSWIPTRRWFWRRGDRERAKLALAGLGSCGSRGLEQVRALAVERRRLAPLAEEIAARIVRLAASEGAATSVDSPASATGGTSEAPPSPSAGPGGGR